MGWAAAHPHRSRFVMAARPLNGGRQINNPFTQEANMDPFSVFPDKPVVAQGVVSERFNQLGIDTFHGACRFVRELPYGYNSDRDDLMILFAEKMGSCTTKHAVIATLALELGLPVHKHVGIYAMTEAIVTGSDRILDTYRLPYLPMIHCFLVCGGNRVDLTEGNANGKNRSIEAFLFEQQVTPTIPARDEYRIYRNALVDQILQREEFQGVQLKTILHAREEGIALLKANIRP
jgi:hypothetical protein